MSAPPICARANQEIQRFGLYRQPRSALAARQHHGLYQRARRIARRHLQADRDAGRSFRAGPGRRPGHAGEIEPLLDESDKQLAGDFSEALGFIKSSIAKMDRLITAILNLTREGRREFHPVKIDSRELIERQLSQLLRISRPRLMPRSGSSLCRTSSAIASQSSRYSPT